MSLTCCLTLVLLFGTSYVINVASDSCPPGWFHFYQDCFIIAENSLPWREAKTECQLFPFEASLPQPQDDKSRLNLATFLQSQGVDDAFWLGASDAMSPGKFRWLSVPGKQGISAGQLDITGPLDVSGPQSSSGWRAVALRVSGSSPGPFAKDPDTMARVVCQRGLLLKTK